MDWWEFQASLIPPSPSTAGPPSLSPLAANSSGNGGFGDGGSGSGQRQRKLSLQPTWQQQTGSRQAPWGGNVVSSAGEPKRKLSPAPPPPPTNSKCQTILSSIKKCISPGKKCINPILFIRHFLRMKAAARVENYLGNHSGKAEFCPQTLVTQDITSS